MIVLDRTEWISRRRVACGSRSFNVHGICGTSCYARFAYHCSGPFRRCHKLRLAWTTATIAPWMAISPCWHDLCATSNVRSSASRTCQKTRSTRAAVNAEQYTGPGSHDRATPSRRLWRRLRFRERNPRRLSTKASWTVSAWNRTSSRAGLVTTTQRFARSSTCVATESTCTLAATAKRSLSTVTWPHTPVRIRCGTWTQPTANRVIQGISTVIVDQPRSWTTVVRGIVATGKWYPRMTAYRIVGIGAEGGTS